MRLCLQLIGWLACLIYSTIPAFWLMIHPFAKIWRARHLSSARSPYLFLLPAWVALSFTLALITRPWRGILLYRANWTWSIASLFFAAGFFLYSQSAKDFSTRKLAGLPELTANMAKMTMVDIKTGA